MRRYDLIFPLGGACSCSQSLRLAGLQFASFPLDWLYGGTPETRVDGLLESFAGWFERERLVRHDIPWQLEHEPWRNTANGIVFKHDFDWNRPLEDMLPAVTARYMKRLERLERLIRSSERVLAVWLNPPNAEEVTPEMIAACRRRLAARFPSVQIDALLLRCDKGYSFDARSDVEADGVRVIAFDYDDGRDQFIDNARMAAFLRGEYAVADYRTPEEIAAWPARQKALRYAQYNATSWTGYVINRAWYRLYRHIRKVIRRKGLDRLG